MTRISEIKPPDSLLLPKSKMETQAEDRADLKVVKQRVKEPRILLEVVKEKYLKRD